MLPVLQHVTHLTDTFLYHLHNNPGGRYYETLLLGLQVLKAQRVKEGSCPRSGDDHAAILNQHTHTKKHTHIQIHTGRNKHN